VKSGNFFCIRFEKGALFSKCKKSGIFIGIDVEKDNFSTLRKEKGF
jgi:hypothetical protein